MTHFVITANRLHDGEVVYLTRNGEWSEWLHTAYAADDDEAKRLLSEVERPGEELRIVGPYLMVVTLASNEIEPRGQRERIRATGPTVHRHFGKQATVDAGHV